MNKDIRTINYIYDSSQPGGAEKQCRLNSKKNGQELINTGNFLHAIIVIYRSLAKAHRETNHVFWLSRDQALGAVLKKFVRNKNNKVFYNIRNQPLNLKDSARSFLYEKIAFLIAVDGWYGNSQSALNAYSRKFKKVPDFIQTVQNIIESGEQSWRYKPNEKIQLIFVGHPNLIKGFDRFVEFVETIGVENVSGIYIFGFAESAASNYQRQILNKFKLNFFGRDDDWCKKKYTNAILVNASRSEGYPSAPLEALSFGIPVLIPDFIEYASELDQHYSYDDLSKITLKRINDIFTYHNGHVEWRK
ncbi:hypothetical protein N9J58_00065 [bacterium]|nr:hypothetical protein [bacterium]